jgi:hypothetical protein
MTEQRINQQSEQLGQGWGKTGIRPHATTAPWPHLDDNSGTVRELFKPVKCADET